MANLINFKGGVSSGGDPLTGDALPENVLEGKTFYSSNSEIKTGNLINVESLVPYDLQASPAKYQLLTEEELINLDLRKWKVPTINSTLTTWDKICYGNGKFVAIASDSSTASTIAVSEDGITWSIIDAPVTAAWKTIFYSNGLFVAISSSANIMISSDGVNWSATLLAATTQYYAMTFNGIKYIAVPYGDDQLLYSNDGGSTWRNSTAIYGKFTSVCYGKGLCVAVGEYATGAATIMTSVDTATWVSRVDPDGTSAMWKSICYGNGLFVAVGNAGHTMRSTDGISWITTIIDSTMNLNCIIYANGMFIAVAKAGNHSIAYSYDGINWDYVYPFLDIKRPLYSIAAGKGRIVITQNQVVGTFLAADFYKK